MYKKLIKGIYIILEKVVSKYTNRSYETSGRDFEEKIITRSIYFYISKSKPPIGYQVKTMPINSKQRKKSRHWEQKRIDAAN